MSHAIGIFGGTFAPIHNGHLRLAIEAREQLGLGEVRLVPAAVPPLRAAPSVPAARRLRWAELAVAGEPGLAVDGRELLRAGPSYTVDTLAALRAEQPAAALCLLLGFDAAQQLPLGHRWESLIELAHLVFFNRPGTTVELGEPLARLLADRAARVPAELHARPAGRWIQLVMPPLGISGSDIRRRLRAGRSIRGLVPDRVIEDFAAPDVEALVKDANA